MAQIGVQQPQNLMEMYSSASPMLWDIANQQVSDQTAGNALNRAQAQQGMDFASQEQPFKLTQLGLANDTTAAQLPGVKASSSMLEDKAKLSRDTMPAQHQAALSELATKVSNNDLTQAENAVKTALSDPSANVRSQAAQMWEHLSSIRELKMKQELETNRAFGMIGMQGKNAQDLMQQQIDAGRFKKPWQMGISMKIAQEGDPIKKQTMITQAIQDNQNNPDTLEYFQHLATANEPLANAAYAAKAAAAAGKANINQFGIESVGAPTVPSQPTASAAFKTPEDIKAAYQSGKLTREQAKKLLQQNHGME